MVSDLKAMLEFNATVPVELATATFHDLDKKIAESGMFYSTSDVQVISETEGKIMTLGCDVGDHVAAGQVLVTVEKEVLESRFQLAKENLGKAEKDLDRFQNLAQGDAVTAQQLETARLTHQNALTEYTSVKRQLNNTTIQAPISGIISERLVEKGTYLSSGERLFTISDQNRMIFRVKVSGADLRHITKGAQTSLTADVLPGQTFEGRVKNIGVTADLAGRYPVEIEVPNSGENLRSGMTGRTTLSWTAAQQRLVIPRKCIEGSLEQAVVFVLNGNVVARRIVVAELLDNDQVAILSGLQPGEEVVTSGQINLKDGSQVNVINHQKTLE